jgi:hypothetical protein
MSRIAVVFKAVKIVAWPGFGRVYRQDAAWLVKFRISSKRRRIAFSKIYKDKSEIFLRGPTRNGDLFRETLGFSGLLDALAGSIILPSVIETSYAVVFYRAGGQQSSAVRASKPYNVRHATAPTIERKVLSHYADRHSVSGREIFGAINRLPKPPQVSSG